MNVRIQVVIEAENGKPERIEEIARLARGSLRPEELGLTLAEAKALLHGMQQVLVAEQVADYLAQFKTCPDCGARRTRNGQHAIVYRTVFGKCDLGPSDADLCQSEAARDRAHGPRPGLRALAGSQSLLTRRDDFEKSPA
jgi:hypothetical protein